MNAEDVQRTAVVGFDGDVRYGAGDLGDGLSVVGEVDAGAVVYDPGGFGEQREFGGDGDLRYPGVFRGHFDGVARNEFGLVHGSAGL